MGTKTKLIIALIGLQFFTHAFYTVKLIRADQREFTCRLESARDTRTVFEILNALGADERARQNLKKIKLRTSPSKIVVNK